ncbi:TIGR00725 family protein, partial [Candidatus Omnitrophota bacterium]
MCTKAVEQVAHRIGEFIAKVEANLVCGGLGGVMEAVSKGTKQAGGTTIGILPGKDKKTANPYIDIAIATGMGHARNTLVVQAADIIIALPGEYGTLSEIANAMIYKKPVISFNSWDIPGVIKVASIEETMRAVDTLL